VDWIHLAQDGDHWQAVVNMVGLGSKNEENLLKS